MEELLISIGNISIPSFKNVTYDKMQKQLLNYLSNNASVDIMDIAFTHRLNPNEVDQLIKHVECLLQINNAILNWHHQLLKVTTDLKIAQIASDQLLPLTIELLPDNQNLLNLAHNALEQSILVCQSNEPGLYLVTLFSAIAFKLQNANHAKLTEEDPSFKKILPSLELIKKQMALHNEIITFKQQSTIRNYDNHLKWLHLAWKNYQAEINECIYEKLNKKIIDQNKIKSVSELNEYLSLYAPTLYKETNLGDYINLYYVAIDIRLTLERKDTESAKLLVEVIEKLDHHKAILIKNDTMSRIKHYIDNVSPAAQLKSSSLLIRFTNIFSMPTFLRHSERNLNENTNLDTQAKESSSNIK